MNLVLGIDCSTQSITGVLLTKNTQYRSHSISYADDLRLRSFGINRHSLIVPPRIAGEADQPPLLFLCALECLLSDLSDDLDRVQMINCSAQQHGHVYLSDTSVFSRLQHPSSQSLHELFTEAFSYQLAPIWMTTNTTAEAEEIRQQVGDDLLSRSGSDIPLRFTAAIIRRIYKQHPDTFKKTERIHLLSSFLTAVLTAQPDAPIDWGNGAGTSLMNYSQHKWDPLLMEATLPRRLPSLLPPLAPAQEIAGSIAPWFTHRFNLPPDCQILVGSGDNPQTKSLTTADLLSLGTSFVYMIHNDSSIFHPHAHAMYDGFSRPFSFICRSNGALVWDRIREQTGTAKDNFAAAEQSLHNTPIGSTKVAWQPITESFPPSPAHPCRGETGTLHHDYPGAVDFSLATFFTAIHHIFPPHQEPLFLCGGASTSEEIIRRIGAFSQRGVIVLGSAGAALGAAAVAAQVAFHSPVSNFTQVTEEYHTSEKDMDAAQKYCASLKE